MTKVLFPGSFDPITKGHMKIIKQASNIFDEVVVAVLKNPDKDKGFFSLEERIEIIKELYKDTENVKTVLGKNTAFETALFYECNAIVRGIRDVNDYVNESRLQKLNKVFSDNRIETVALFADGEYQFISSSIVKLALDLNKPIDNYVEPIVKEKMLIKRSK